MAELRLFFAIPVSPMAEYTLSAEVAKLRSRADLLAAGNIRWIAPVNYHLTMAFLGNVKPAKITELDEIANSVVANHQLQPIQLSALGWFPSALKPRAIVALAQAGKDLIGLQKDLLVSLRQQGFHCQGKAFRPHITLARGKDLQAPMDLRSLPISITNDSNELVLYKSELNSKGAIYTPLITLTIGATL